MALAGKVAINTVIQILTRVITTGLSLIALALTTRYLGRYSFGEYTTAVSWVTFFSIAADLGLTLVTAQLLSRPGADTKAVMSNLFTFRVVSGFLILALAPLVIFFFPYSTVIKEGASVAALAFYFVILSQVCVSFFQRELRTDRTAVAEIAGRLLFLGLTIWGVSANIGVVGLLWVMTAANGVSFFIQWWYARRTVPFTWHYDRAVWRDIMQRSWPLVITIVLNLVYLKADILILSLFQSQEDVGLYGAAYRVVDSLVTIPFMLGGTILPILAARWQTDQKTFRHIWQKIFDASSLLAWPLVVGGFMLATPIMRLLSGAEFAAAGPILKILIVAVGFIFFSCLFSYTMVSLDQQRKLITAYLVTAVTSLLLYVLLIPHFSYTAAAWITVYSEVVMSLFAWHITKRATGLRISFGRFGKALVASLIMGVCLTFFSSMTVHITGLLLTVVSAMLIYLIVLYLLRGFSKEDVLELLPNRLN